MIARLVLFVVTPELYELDLFAEAHIQKSDTLIKIQTTNKDSDDASYW